MGPQKSASREDPFAILFLTRSGSRKAREIGRTGRLSVLYQHDADDGYVTLIGRGVILADRALLRARWQPAWNQFFPAGADDETSIFVRIRSTTALVNSVVPAWPPRSGVLTPEAIVSSTAS